MDVILTGDDIRGPIIECESQTEAIAYIAKTGFESTSLADVDVGADVRDALKTARTQKDAWTRGNRQGKTGPYHIRYHRLTPMDGEEWADVEGAKEGCEQHGSVSEQHVHIGIASWLYIELMFGPVFLCSVRYRVSSYGRVVGDISSTDIMILHDPHDQRKLGPITGGYYRVNVRMASGKQELREVHRLVAQHMLLTPDIRR